VEVEVGADGLASASLSGAAAAAPPAGAHHYIILIMIMLFKKVISYKKKHWRPPSKKKKRGKNPSPRNMKACHNIGAALTVPGGACTCIAGNS
jgi:hypothetical protein